MTGPTHVVGGALAGLVVSAAGGLGIEHAAALTVGSVAASRLPDLDAKVLRGPDHRSFPHSLVFGGGGVILTALVLLGWLASSAGEEVALGVLSAETISLAVVGAVLGYLTHLALDAATKSGIWLLMPGGRSLGLPREWAVRTGGLVELAEAAAMSVMVLGLGLAASRNPTPVKSLKLPWHPHLCQLAACMRYLDTFDATAPGAVQHGWRHSSFRRARGSGCPGAGA